MQKIVKNLFSAPSIRLNTLVVLEIVFLLLVSLGGLFYFTRKGLVEESKLEAEYRLESTVQQVDNVLMSIEQTVGNFYFNLMDHLDDPNMMNTYCRKLVESNPNIHGCAIAFTPNYYPGREHFFTYVYRKKYHSAELISLDEAISIPYTQQNWFSETMKNGRSAWVDPGLNADHRIDPVITFCLPIRNHNKECVGVLAAGLSISLLSQIVLETKPSPNSYSILLAQDGSYIVHPVAERLKGGSVFKRPDIAESPSALAAAQDMVKGNTGNSSFRLDNFTWYIFYKPFVRDHVRGSAINTLHWSIATIYPKDDIFGEYNYVVLHVLGIVAVALLVFFMLCRRSIRKQLKPLTYLTESAERIAYGHYDESIPDVKRDDEVGVFYQHFQAMQKALADNISKLNEQQATLSEHSEKLKNMYQQMQDDEQVKATFLHNITNRMIAPAESIKKSVNTLCDNLMNITLQDANQEIANIKQQSETVIELLNHKFNVSPNHAGKEENHE